jgi:copper(I)-binding protein
LNIYILLVFSVDKGPHSAHIMIEDLPKIMTSGAKFNVILVFQKSGEAAVATDAPGRR